MVSSGLVAPSAAGPVEPGVGVEVDAPVAPALFLADDGAADEADDAPVSVGNGPVRSAQSLIGSGPIMTSKASSSRPHEPNRASGLSGPTSCVYMLAHLFGKLSGPEYPTDENPPMALVRPDSVAASSCWRPPRICRSACSSSRTRSRPGRLRATRSAVLRAVCDV